MRMNEARKIMQEIPRSICQNGFMVSFEHKRGGMLISDHFPDKHAGETLIETEAEAWSIAEKFAAATVGRCVNVYVIDADFVPVKGYKLRQIENRQSA